MLSRFSTASGVSIFAMMGVGLSPRLADLADQVDVVGAAHERQRDVVDAVREAEEQIVFVFLGERADAHRACRKVHADVVAHRAALFDDGA